MHFTCPAAKKGLIQLAQTTVELYNLAVRRGCNEMRGNLRAGPGQAVQPKRLRLFNSFLRMDTVSEVLRPA